MYSQQELIRLKSLPDDKLKKVLKEMSPDELKGFLQPQDNSISPDKFIDDGYPTEMPPDSNKMISHATNNSQENPYLQKLRAINEPFKEISRPLNNFFGGAYEGIGKLGEGLGGIPVGIVNKLFGTDYQIPETAQVPGINRNSLATSAGNLAGFYGPQIAPVGKLAGLLSRTGSATLPSSMLAASAGGFAAQPGDIGERALNAGIEGLGTGAIGLAAKGIGGTTNLIKHKDYLKQASREKKATEIYNKLLNGAPLGQESDKYIARGVRDSYQDALNASKEQYENVFELAEKEGFGYKKPIEKLSKKRIEELYKKFGVVHIPKDEVVKNQIKKPIVSKKLNSKEVKEAISKNKKLSDAYKKFKREGSLKSAHRLQSKLGEVASVYSSSKDSTNRLLAKEYSDIRKFLMNDINKSLDKKGSLYLKKEYQKATKNFAETVAPFRDNASLRKVAKSTPDKYSYAKNLANLFSKNDSSVEYVLKKLPEETRNIIAARSLEGAVQKEAGKNVVDVDKIKKIFKNLNKKGMDKYFSSESKKEIEDFIMKSEAGEKLAKKLKIYGGSAGLAAGAATGINYLNPIGTLKDLIR